MPSSGPLVHTFMARREVGTTEQVKSVGVAIEDPFGECGVRPVYQVGAASAVWSEHTTQSDMWRLSNRGLISTEISVNNAADKYYDP